MALTEYQSKRNFKDSPEPKGKATAKTKFNFVIQRHEASRLHYDLRLQLGGVLKSWAVPKGPSLDPADKRLAVMVEDHPVDYISFEGIIPKGNYGAGKVQIWDEGTFTPVDAQQRRIPEAQAIRNLEAGELKFELEGSKARGGFVLVRLKGEKKNWLLIKHRDAFVETPYDSEDHLDGHRPKKKEASGGTVAKPATTPKKYSTFFKPMLASLADNPFDHEDWVFEIKWDGYRAVAEWKDKTLKFYSRNGLSFVDKYKPIAGAIRKLRKDVVLDGEIVLFNEAHQPDFQKLQQYEDNKHLPLHYYVFDLLYLDGEDLRQLPLTERKKMLKKVLGKNDLIRYCDHLEKEGIAFFNTAVENNLEGIIAKRAASGYTCGVRTKEWLKIKHQHTREAIIAGYTEPRGSRKHFGALILAAYEDKNLKYIGHTGTGFDEKTLKALWHQMQEVKAGVSPFSQKIRVNAPVTWLKPALICQVSFTEETEGGMLRHPVFLGLREDKTAREVQRAHEKAEQVIEAVETAKTESARKKPAKKEAVKKKSASNKEVLRIGRFDVAVTNTDKVWWPEEQIKKGDIIQYYRNVAKYLLPHLKDRPLSLKRNPNGITDKGFFHKDAGDAAPGFVKTHELYSGANDKMINYVICNNEASLVYIANLGSIEINPWNSTYKKPDHPTWLVMDLDPSDKNTFDEVIEAATVVKAVLDHAGATCYCKTSGATGLHVYIPLGGKYTYDQTKEFGEIIATLVHENLPDTTSMERTLVKRGNKIYLDYLQNRKGQTLASVYSARPKAGATVSTPLEWKEVKPGLDPAQFDIFNITKRLERTGDLFAGVLEKGIDLKKCLKNLGS